jgi:uncharacterized protein
MKIKRQEQPMKTITVRMPEELIRGSNSTRPRTSAISRERGISFALAVEFDWTAALVLRSDRAGETRYMAMGEIAGRLHVLVYTKRGQSLRIISLRRANKREVKRYEKTRP